MLTAMNYPFVDNLDCTDARDLRILVRWLEDRKIRELEIEDREKLFSEMDWETCFSNYLSSLNSPLILNQKNKMDCLEWVASYAISLDYEDQLNQMEVEADRHITSDIDLVDEKIDLICQITGISRNPNENNSGSFICF